MEFPRRHTQVRGRPLHCASPNASPALVFDTGVCFLCDAVHVQVQSLWLIQDPDASFTVAVPQALLDAGARCYLVAQHSIYQHKQFRALTQSFLALLPFRFVNFPSTPDDAAHGSEEKKVPRALLDAGARCYLVAARALAALPGRMQGRATSRGTPRESVQWMAMQKCGSDTFGTSSLT